jgi:hypothetical protein
LVSALQTLNSINKPGDNGTFDTGRLLYHLLRLASAASLVGNSRGRFLGANLLNQTGLQHPIDNSSYLEFA